METASENLQTILAEIGKKFTVAFESMEIDGQPLQILAINNMPEHLDRLLAKNAIHNPLRDLPLWAKIWPASFVLGRFLRKYKPEGKTMLELGCGMGVCSLIAARYGFSRIVATDLASDALNFARANVLRNALENIISVKHLDILAPRRECPEPGCFDFIAASEILYLEELHRPLLKFLDRCLAPGGHAFFCSDLSRIKPHFRKLAAKQFALEEGNIGVKSTAANGEESRRIFNILILEKK